ncbi:MAG TPA: hypothetical protein VGC40_09125 [Paenirhodobacter sp.]
MTEDSRSATAYNDQNTGRFTSGNPGRPRGSRNALPLQAMRRIQEMTPAALEQLELQVSAGNFDAIRFVLERIIGKNRFVELNGDKPADISTALVNGEISTDEAKAIATVVEKLRRIEDLDAVQRRLVEIEKILLG